MKPLLDKNEWPDLAVYDIEATDWVNIVCVGHVDEFGNKKAFHSIEGYLNWLYSNKFKGSHVWAHWGGHYDHRFVIAYATRSRGWSWETIQSGNLLIIIKVKHPSGRIIYFCESARLMPDSVEKIGKTVGLEKLDVDRQHIEKLTLQETVKYCIRDCEIVLLGLQYMRSALNSVGCDFAFTLASISTRWVRRSDVLEWMKFYEKIEGQYEYSPSMLRSDEFCLPAYFGGRVEVFKTGKFKNLYYYDITSSYPWSMLHELPAYFEGFHPPPKNLDDALDHCGISEASIYIPRGTLHVPVLPVRYDGKLIFPEGVFRGRWTNLELRALRERTKRKGVKIKIHGQARYKELAFLKPFVDTFYGLRNIAKKENDNFRSYTYKIALNSLYGKLVENIHRKSIVYGDLVNDAIEKHGPKAVEMTQTPGIYSVSTINLGPFRHVAAGAYVTARSRLRLLEGIECCLREGANIYYCDTDSIITDKPIKSFESDKVVLGGFELEYEFLEAEFICPKVYRAITKDGKSIYKVKGMPVKGLSDKESLIRWYLYTQNINDEARNELAKLNLSEEDIIRLGSKEGIAGFLTDLNKGNIEPRKQLLKRQLNNEDSKRVHYGNKSEPLYIDMSEEVGL